MGSKPTHLFERRGTVRGMTAGDDREAQRIARHLGRRVVNIRLLSAAPRAMKLAAWL
jgi:hypothetical protein